MIAGFGVYGDYNTTAATDSGTWDGRGRWPTYTPSLGFPILPFVPRLKSWLLDRLAWVKAEFRQAEVLVSRAMQAVVPDRPCVGPTQRRWSRYYYSR